MSHQDPNSNLKGYVNLNYIVNLVLMDLKDDHTINEKIILQYAILGFTELNLYTSPAIKVIYLPLSQAKTINMPEDMMEYIKIGMNIHGVLYTFTENNELVLPRDVDACGNTLPMRLQCNNIIDGVAADQSPFNSQIANWGYYFAQHYRNGEFVGELYGTRGYNSVYFRADWDRRQIAFTGLVDEVQEVILEYVSTNIQVGGTAIVDRRAVQALRAYVHYELAANDKRSTESKIHRLWNQYTMQYDKLHIYQLTPPTVEAYKDAMYRDVSLNPRR